jgi:hypothetical protein
MNTKIEIEAQELLEEYETTLLGHYRNKDVVAILKILIADRDKWKGLVEPMQDQVLLVQEQLPQLSKERDYAKKALKQAILDLKNARRVHDSDYTRAGDHVWLLNKGKRWRTDFITAYTIDNQGRVETINGQKLGTPSGSDIILYERRLLEVLEQAAKSLGSQDDITL